LGVPRQGLAHCFGRNGVKRIACDDDLAERELLSLAEINDKDVKTFESHVRGCLQIDFPRSIGV